MMMKQFKESLASVVLTSKWVMTRESPIVRISHHEDGIWEFFGKENITEEEVIVVSLKQIIDVDPTVLEVADMPMAFNAFRQSVDTSWKLVSKN